MHYAVDLRHPLQAPCGGDHQVQSARKDKYPVVEGRGNVGIPKGFPKIVGRGWKAGFMAFHAFHNLSFPWPDLAGDLEKSATPPSPIRRTTAYRDRSSMSASAICRSSRSQLTRTASIGTDRGLQSTFEVFPWAGSNHSLEGLTECRIGLVTD
jgi:hypothetical protein